ncbi:MAG: HDOD domain-containing protein [Planctomycetota bacterium]
MKTHFDELKLTGKLPSPAGVGMAILRLTQSDNFTVKDLAQTIQSDPALSGRILKMANSAAVAGRDPITEIPKAVVRLGVRTVRNTALGFSLVSGHRGGACRRFDFERYWSSSLGRAVAAQTLGRALRMVSPADGYICALLSGIGKLALATVHPKAYDELLAKVRIEDDHALALAERECFEIDHREVAARMLEDWKMPEAHARALARFSDRSREDSEDEDALTRSLCRTLRIVAPLASIMLAADGTHHTLWEAFAEATSDLDVPSEHLWETCDTIASEWREWGDLLAVPTQPVPSFRSIAERYEADREAAPHDGAEITTLRPDSESAGHEGEVDLAAPEERLTVLAVDDEPAALLVLATHLKRAGYLVCQATDGSEALAKALEVNPHIVITDLVMPEMDGVELCRSLRSIKIGRDMYLMVLTGTEQEDDVVRAFDAGADDYITKPFNPGILMARVKAGERVVHLQAEVKRDKQMMELQVAEMAILNRKLRMTATTDALTKLPNRQYAERCLGDSWTAAGGKGAGALSLVMIDIDHFKSVNDNFGHDTGDVVLQEVSNVLAENLREGYTVCRLGGEEFLAICPGASAETATEVAERLRSSVENHPVHHGDFHRNVTISLGVAERSAAMESCDDLLKAADVALYRSKREGRNRVSVATVATPAG